MSSLFKFENWQFLVEMARRPRKCPILDFSPLFKTSNYRDVVSLGGREETPAQAKLQGNLRFDYPDFNMQIRLNLNGAIWSQPRRDEGTNLAADAIVVDPEAEVFARRHFENRDGKSIQIFPSNQFQSDKYFKECLTIEDFEMRLEYVIKEILHRKGVLSLQEARNDEHPNVMLLNKIAEDPDFLSELMEKSALPPSLGGKAENILKVLIGFLQSKKVMDYESIIDTLSETNPKLPEELESKGFDMAAAKKLSKRARILSRED